MDQAGRFYTVVDRSRPAAMADAVGQGHWAGHPKAAVGQDHLAETVDAAYLGHYREVDYSGGMDCAAMEGRHREGRAVAGRWTARAAVVLCHRVAREAGHSYPSLVGAAALQVPVAVECQHSYFSEVAQPDQAGILREASPDRDQTRCLASLVQDRSSSRA